MFNTLEFPPSCVTCQDVKEKQTWKDNCTKLGVGVAKMATKCKLAECSLKNYLLTIGKVIDSDA